MWLAQAHREVLAPLSPWILTSRKGAGSMSSGSPPLSQRIPTCTCMHIVCHTRLQEKGSLRVLKTLVLDCLHLPRCNNAPSSPLPLLLPLENETKQRQQGQNMAMGRSRKTWSARPEHTGLRSGGDRITQSKEERSQAGNNKGSCVDR